MALIETECSVLQVLQVIQALTEHRRSMTDVWVRQSPAACFIDLILQEWAEGECGRKVWYIEKIKSNACFLFKAGLAHFYYRWSGQEWWEFTSLRKLLSPIQHPLPSLPCVQVWGSHGFKEVGSSSVLRWSRGVAQAAGGQCPSPFPTHPCILLYSHGNPSF